MTHLHRWTIIATAAGLALAIWTLGAVGLRQTVAILSGLGLLGFLAFLASYALVLLALGGAWSSSARGQLHRFPAFVGARAVREAANDLLPFSQIGGLVLGLRALIQWRVPAVRAYAATIIDLTTETASQALLVLCGIVMAVDIIAGGTRQLRTAIWVGTAALCLTGLALLMLRGPALALAMRMADRIVPAAGVLIGEVRSELAAFERRRFALLPSFLWNAAAWLLAVFSVWLALALLGQNISLNRVLALEALISVVRSSAFFVPGAVGVQEVAYVLLATLVGLDKDAALALSLLKRARDVAVGVPTLLIWQAAMMRKNRMTIDPTGAINPK